LQCLIEMAFSRITLCVTTTFVTRRQKAVKEISFVRPSFFSISTDQHFNQHNPMQSTSSMMTANINDDTRSNSNSNSNINSNSNNNNNKIDDNVGYDEDILKEKEDEILKLRKGLEIVMEGAAEMELMIEIDSKMITHLSTKLETVLMENADANANAETEADPNSLREEFDHDYNQDQNLNIEIATLNAKMAAEAMGDIICLLKEQNKYDDRISTSIEIQRELKELGSRIGDLFGADDDDNDGIINKWSLLQVFGALYVFVLEILTF
jgi:hypothetical protein